MSKANQALLASGTYHVAETDDRVMMGCGGWTCERPGTAERQFGIAHIRHFATRADCTGRGIGRMIYGYCEAQARSAGIVTFECYSSLNAEGFYLSLGFVAVDRIQIPFGNNIALPVVLMRRFIT